jgi:hypothetical protein
MADGTILIRWLEPRPAAVAERVVEAVEAEQALEPAAEPERQPVRHLRVHQLPEPVAVVEVEVAVEPVADAEELQRPPQPQRISSAPNRICFMSRT